MQNPHSFALGGQNLRQSAVRLRRFVESATAENDSFGAKPFVDHVPGDFAWRDDTRFRAPASFLSTRLGARHYPPRAVHGGPKGSFGFLGCVTGTFEDHRVIAHRSADETALTRKCRSSAFAHHDQIFTAVSFLPREVVMIVDEIELVSAK